MNQIHVSLDNHLYFVGREPSLSFDLYSFEMNQDNRIIVDEGSLNAFAGYPCLCSDGIENVGILQGFLKIWNVNTQSFSTGSGLPNFNEGVFKRRLKGGF